ncbi:MAG TPA: SemiSWEET transporter [Chitinispirillaceae bacterium]|nr:SemiSWEET transporter [Chitinispirillaceae bacterium]
MNPVTIIGFLGGILTTVSFLPQVIHIWKTHSTRDLSAGMFLLFSFGVLLWLIYGFFLRELPVIIANSVTLILSITILVFKFKYK